MSVVKRGTRVGAAVFALGLSLAGPQAAGTASAEPADSGENSTVSGPRHNSADGAAARPSRGADFADRGRRGRVNPETPDSPGTAQMPELGQSPDLGPSPELLDPDLLHPAALERADIPPSVELPVQSSRRGSGRNLRQAGREFPDGFAASAGTAPVPRADVDPDPAIAVITAAALPAAAVAGSPADTPSGSVSGRVAELPRPAASAVDIPELPTTPLPPALARPVAAISTAVTGFFDSAANWLGTLPSGPVAEFLEGALLLVRRTLFTLFPMLNASQTTGQTDPDVDAYFTDAAMQDYLLQLAEQRYGDLFGQTVPVHGWGPYPEYLKTDVDGPNSDTNTQVDGVDEADFVENDGRYIYTARHGRLTIVSVEDLSVVSQSNVDGDVLGQYLDGDRLTVISQTGSGWYGPHVKMAYPGFWAWNPQTTVAVYDVTDRSAPTVINQTLFDGAYQSSRSIGGVVYVVTQRSVKLPTPQFTEVPVKDGNVEVLQGDSIAESMIRYDPSAPVAYRTYETWDSYVARVGDDIVALSLPHAYGVDVEGNVVDLGLVVGAEGIVRPRADNQQAVLTVVAVDSGRTAGGSGFEGSVGAMVSANGGGTVYMNQGALYVATAEDFYSDTRASNHTRIDRFVVAGSKLSWQASGLVSGTLINQFAMDEQDEHLRVATHTFSTQWADGTTVTREDSGVYVLDTAGDTLDEVGRLTGLAPGEQLYAVRYVGDTAYLVTFLRTDPLFAVDLRDPAAPTLLGELVVPGFSNYLQSVGDGLLLGIGQEREPDSWNTHVHATLFDVSDGSNLTQIEREFLDPDFQWSWSQAQFDHHALLYSEQDGLLVVPVSGSGYDPATGYQSRQYLKVLRVSESGIEVIGEIHPDEPVLRTVRIGDVLYAVGDNTVAAYRLSDLSEIGSTASYPAVL